MLRIEGLQRRVGRFQLTIDELIIAQGGYVVIVGPSGAGKTMLLETIAGLHQPDSGRVLIEGQNVTDAPPEKRGIGLVYQDCWLFPHLTVRQNIDFGRRYQRHSRAAETVKTDELAEMLNITPLMDRPPQTLSGGERQRVALARALAIRPRLLFLDEPLGMLDPVSREHVAAELLSCHRAFGMTTIHVTHDHTEARMMGDAVAVLLGGALEQVGPTDQVFWRPRTSRLATFLGCENLFDGEAVPSETVGVAQVEVASGPSFRLESQLNGKVQVCVRSEAVRVGLVPDGHRPAAGRADESLRPSESDHVDIAIEFEGQVMEMSPRGPVMRLVIESSGRRWTSLISASEIRGSRVRIGDRVSVSVPSDSVHLIGSR